MVHQTVVVGPEHHVVLVHVPGLLGGVDLEIGCQDVLVAVVELLLGLDPVLGRILFDDRVPATLGFAGEDSEAPRTDTDDANNQDDHDEPTQAEAARAVQFASLLVPVVIHDILSPAGHTHPRSVTRHEKMCRGYRPGKFLACQSTARSNR